MHRFRSQFGANAKDCLSLGTVFPSLRNGIFITPARLDTRNEDTQIPILTLHRVLVGEHLLKSQLSSRRVGAHTANRKPESHPAPAGMKMLPSISYDL